jgi:hypothetical protein
VIIDADQDHVVFVHRRSFRSDAGPLPQGSAWSSLPLKTIFSQGENQHLPRATAAAEARCWTAGAGKTAG